MNSDYLKLFGVIGFIVLIIGLLFIIKVQSDQNLEQKAINASLIEMKQMQDDVVRSKNEFVSKEQFEKLTKDLNFNFKQIEKDLEKYNATPTAIETIRVVTTPQILVNQPTEAGENINPQQKPEDYFGYLKREQTFPIFETIGKQRIPFAKIGFIGWDKNPWNANIYARSYILNTVIGEDDDGRYYTYSHFTVETQGKKYSIPITESKIEQKIPEHKWRFNPKLMLGMGGGVVFKKQIRPDINPTISLSLSSVGPTKTNSEWVIGIIGVGYQGVDEEINFIASPGGYNIGYKLPLIDNLIIAPAASINFKGDFGIFLGVHASL